MGNKKIVIGVDTTGSTPKVVNKEGTPLALTEGFNENAILAATASRVCQNVNTAKNTMGNGFGAEGDWKTAALVRAMKVMTIGMKEGSSFMEDYTYHFKPGNNSVLGSHMLEICPTIANAKPSCEVHPLGIGGKADPVRLVFNGAVGDAINATVIDLGDRFRLLVNEVKAIEMKEPLPNLPVARVLWKPLPDLRTAASAWILGGGAHHTCYSQAVNTAFMENFANMFDIEMTLIDNETKLRDLKNELRWNEVYYRMNKEY